MTLGNILALDDHRLLLTIHMQHPPSGPLVVAGDYTLGAETSRRVSSGLSEAQFNDFLEHAFLVLTAFFQEFEASALAKTAAVNNG